MCEINSIVCVDEYTVEMYFPDGQCCDMTGAIRVAMMFRPKVVNIETFSGGAPDTSYGKFKGGWGAMRVSAEA